VRASIFVTSLGYPRPLMRTSAYAQHVVAPLRTSFRRWSICVTSMLWATTSNAAVWSVVGRPRLLGRAGL